MGKFANRLQAWRLRHARTIPATVRPDLVGAGPSPRERGEAFLGEGEVAAAIDAAVAARRPFSFLRLGDGEGALLGFARDATAEDLRYFLAHFDRPRAPSAIWRLRVSLLQAIASADIVGIRDDVWNAEGADRLDPKAADFVGRFRQCFPLRPSEILLPHGAQRIFRLYEWWRQSAIPGAFCSQWVHADLQVHGYFDDLIAGQKRIGLITNATDLPARIRRRFGVEVTLIEVPSNTRNPGLTGAPSRQEEQHFAVWPSIAAAIPRDLDGMVVFVGAGLIGKQYCTIVKANGGIALDLGALLDAWDGRATRGIVHRAKAALTASPFAPPPSFLLGHGKRQRRNDGRRIILHAGMPETGEVRLQALLASNEAELSEAGIHYLRAGRSDRLPVDPVGLRDFLAGIDAEIGSSDDRVFILSIPDAASRIHRAVEDDFLEWLLSRNVTVLLTLRPQFEWLVDRHRRAAAEGRMDLPLDEFLADPLRAPDGERFDGNYLRRIDYFRRYLPDENVLVERSADDPRQAAWLREPGIDTGRLASPGPAESANEPEEIANLRVVLRDKVMAPFAETNAEILRRYGVDLR